MLRTISKDVLCSNINISVCASHGVSRNIKEEKAENLLAPKVNKILVCRFIPKIRVLCTKDFL